MDARLKNTSASAERLLLIAYRRTRVDRERGGEGGEVSVKVAISLGMEGKHGRDRHG